MADRSLNSLTPDAEGRVPGHEDNHYKGQCINRLPSIGVICLWYAYFDFNNIT